jgi:hypothetical protein
MFYHRRNTTVMALIIIVVLIGFVYRSGRTDHAYEPNALANNEGNFSQPAAFESFLGKGFDEIVDALGEPSDEGYAFDYGPHEFILYEFENGSVRFCSPEGLEDPVAISIIVLGELEVMGTSVGMSFMDIQAILGESDYGPAYGLDDTYHMVYYFEDHEGVSGHCTVTFSAASLEGPTYEAFIKLENFDYVSYTEV